MLKVEALRGRKILSGSLAGIIFLVTSVVYFIVNYGLSEQKTIYDFWTYYRVMFAFFVIWSAGATILWILIGSAWEIPIGRKIILTLIFLAFLTVYMWRYEIVFLYEIRNKNFPERLQLNPVTMPETFDL